VDEPSGAELAPASRLHILLRQAQQPAEYTEVNGKFVLTFPINDTLTFPINDILIKYNSLQYFF
jgi:hypothetical protein